MNRKSTLAVLVAVALGSSAFGSGFALYQASAVSHAMGGALVGKAMDASANFHNPATLTDLTNVTVTVGFVTEHPRGELRGKCDGWSWGHDSTFDAGLFWLPHFQLAVPLPYDFAFGLGGMPEYGLGTEYDKSSPIAWNAQSTTVQGYVFNPNLAYKITDKWSVAAGLRWLFFTFEQDKVMPAMNYHLYGDNRFESLGWQVGTKYDILDNLSAGLVYKAPIPVNVRGDTDAKAKVPAAAETAANMKGDANAELTLPQSITGGVNWDVVDTWHLGLAVSWTQWSEFDTLVFNVKPQKNPVALNWNDTWRASVGSCWDFYEDWKWMISYTFDMDCCLDKTQESVMLPAAHRNILATGFAWEFWQGLELSLSYACIFMDGGSMDFVDRRGVSGAPNSHWHVETCRGFCHAVGASLTYRF